MREDDGMKGQEKIAKQTCGRLSTESAMRFSSETSCTIIRRTIWYVFFFILISFFFCQSKKKHILFLFSFDRRLYL